MVATVYYNQISKTTIILAGFQIWGDTIIILLSLWFFLRISFLFININFSVLLILQPAALLVGFHVLAQHIFVLHPIQAEK
jgi:hypothetical protein